jgi:hypothetical protein
LIPLATISGPADQVATIVDKLNAAEPLGISFPEMDGLLAAILAGLNESYVLLEPQDQREELMLWQHASRLAGGAYAVVVESTQAGQDPGNANPESVLAIFECRSGGA